MHVIFYLFLLIMLVVIWFVIIETYIFLPVWRP